MLYWSHPMHVTPELLALMFNWRLHHNWSQLLIQWLHSLLIEARAISMHCPFYVFYTLKCLPLWRVFVHNVQCSCCFIKQISTKHCTYSMILCLNYKQIIHIKWKALCATICIQITDANCGSLSLHCKVLIGLLLYSTSTAYVTLVATYICICSYNHIHMNSHAVFTMF